jgi:hypothetical protein
MVINVQALPTGQLLQEYREVMLALGRNPGDASLSRRADLLEEEVSRRMAW